MKFPPPILFRVLAPFGVVCCSVSIHAEEVDFNRQIRPLLAERCFRCHGPDEATVEAGLRLDSFEGATAELETGEHAIVAGKPDSSEMIRRISSEEEFERMPPPDAGSMLTENEQQLLRRWITDGAKYEGHWSFQPIRRPPLPEVESALADRTPIDRFVARKMTELKLSPNDEADRLTLIRRLSLDLTGLPPTIERADSFVADQRPNAYELLVDELLASNAYGERWAHVWLDLARYADSAGYAQDPSRNIWRYRDWVIQAINRNLPFDQFTIEQLAGDLLPNPTHEQLIATAFHRNTMTNSEGGTDDEEFRNAAVVDRVNTTMQVWMGMTMGCAQCHTHKYDPITIEEYFKFFAILNNTQDADRGDESPNLHEYSPAEKKRRSELQTEIKELESELALAKSVGDKPNPELVTPPSGEPSVATPDKAGTTNNSETNTKILQDELNKKKKELGGIRGTKTPILRELAADKRRKTLIQIRGNFKQTADEVTPGTPAVFPSIGTEEVDRLAMANWLVRDDNPLTARVTVNRYWEQLFGVGLVETSEDFGTQGQLPSHPELLDYLAADFMESGWNVKRLLKTIVMSATYRQSSKATPAAIEADPNNRWLARGPRFRMSGEMLRDQALASSGLLARKMLGPSVRPPRPKLGLRAAFGGSTDWEPSKGEDRYRRGLYTSWRRTTPYPSLMTFDAPSREFCTIRRIRTNTPLQALVTLNDPAFVEAAQSLARVIHSSDGNLESKVAHGFRRVLIRHPKPEETTRLVALFNRARNDYVSRPEDALALATEPLGPTKMPAATDDSAEVTELAAWTVVSNVLLNLDETISKP